MQAKIGPLIGVGGSRQGISQFYEKMQGKPFVVMVNEDKGGLEEAMRFGGDHWTYLFRVTGQGIDVPNYQLTPYYAARAWWDKVVPKLTGVPECVWIHAGNELDKNRMAWLGTWGGCMADVARGLGRRLVLFNFAAGEPEPEHWRVPDMAMLLDDAAHDKDRLAIGLHEYSYEVADGPDRDGMISVPAIWRGYPWQVGRYLQLWKACDGLGIPHPTVLITEFGWCLDSIPGHDRAIRDVQIANALYDDPDILGVGLWYSGGGAEWKGICFKVEKLFPEWGDYMASLGTDPGIPGPEPGTIDLAELIVGEPGVQHVLQCRFGTHFQGTQTLCTRDLGDSIYAQQKDAEQEIIYYDDHYIYRETDTSPGEHDGRKAFYCQYQDGRRGAYWCDRFVRVGDLFDRTPDVIHMRFDDCRAYAAAQVPSQLRVVAYYPHYLFDEGYSVIYPVVQLAWEVDGRIVERYFYGRRRGLVRWVNEERGWKSFLVEEHVGRPPMPLPAWPSCFDPPGTTDDPLYYREPEGQPLPSHVRVKPGVTLNIRTGPGTNHPDVGDLHPAGGRDRGTIEVVQKKGDWYQGLVWFSGRYVDPA